MTILGINHTAKALAFLQKMQETTANNLANANTAGFKLDRLTGRLDAEGPGPEAVHVTDLAQGPMQVTGSDFDVALAGAGFLVVRTPAGERLSRGGSLRLDAGGQLVEQDGAPVLGTRGPILAPAGTLRVEADGSVFVGGEFVDTLRLETVADPATLRKEGAGRFVAAGATVRAEGLVVRQGQLERANGDVLGGMVDLVTIQRAYTANVDALKAMDGVLATVAGDVGRLG
ncbi:MAG: flagellar hook-basal body complex protein [Gemmatimonadales bacterium]|nr:flagellar hook-basal body complex protein [Gemmatimonadales bacterium]